MNTEVSVIKESWFEILASRKSELLNRSESSGKVRLIAVFGGSNVNEGSAEWKQAYNVGLELAKRGAIVFNGGYGGTMAASAAGARSVGGLTVGVTCTNLPEGEVNSFIEIEWKTSRWDQRLLSLIFLADGYAVMPGSSGTLVELAMVIETQLKGFIPARPVVCLGNHWKPVVKRIIGTNKMVSFIKKADRLAEIIVSM